MPITNTNCPAKLSVSGSFVCVANKALLAKRTRRRNHFAGVPLVHFYYYFLDGDTVTGVVGRRCSTAKVFKHHLQTHRQATARQQEETAAKSSIQEEDPMTIFFGSDGQRLRWSYWFLFGVKFHAGYHVVYMVED